MDGIRDLLSRYKFDVLALNETFLSPDINDTDVTIPEYRLARKDRSNSTKSTGGGVIIFIRDNIPFAVRSDLMDDRAEILWVEITRNKCKPLLIASVYRPPDYSQRNFFDSINSSLAKVNGNNYEIAILGDFNLDQMPGKGRLAIRLVNSFSVENDLKQLICEPTRTRDRDYHHKKARKSNSKYHWGMYRKLRNLANREDKRLKSEYFCNLINDSKGDSAKMWKSLKQVIPDSKSTVKEVQALKVKHKVFTKPSEIVEISNKHFSTIGQKLGQCFGRNVDVDRFPLKTETNFSLNPVSENFVRDQLRQLKPNKAIGLDKVSSRLLKDSANVNAPVLMNIINCSSRNKSFPQSWKSAKVMALFKNSDADNCDNCRPISVLPTVSKIVERATQAHTAIQPLGFERPSPREAVQPQVRYYSSVMTYYRIWRTDL